MMISLRIWSVGNLSLKNQSCEMSVIILRYKRKREWIREQCGPARVINSLAKFRNVMSAPVTRTLEEGERRTPTSR